MAETNTTQHARNFIDLTGQRFGRWTVSEQANIANKYARWKCVCDCGTLAIVTGADLRRGSSLQCRSCGSASHGLSHIPEHKIWMGIKCRCKCPSATGYARYGGRHIAVCESWRNSFEAFYRDMGPRPTPKHTIERKDNDKGYCKSNCVWATRTEQMRNMSRNHTITFDGKTQCLQAWADELGLNKSTLRKRLKRGWSIERAFGESSKVKSERLLEFNGTTQSVAAWAKDLGMVATTLYTRLNAGWTAERALTTPVG